MNTQFTLNNFRVFGDQGAQFELSPITLLTGCNSAGKSSLVKALMLLTDCLKNVESKIELNKDFSLDDVCIDFSSMHNSSMGRFDKVLNRAAKRNDAITFAYTTYSNFMAEQLAVELSFVAQSSDELNRGWLSAISFKKSSGEVIISARTDENKQFQIETMDLTTIKKNFLNWATYTCGLSVRYNLITTELLGEEFWGNEVELTELFKQIKESVQILQISKKCASDYQLLLDLNNRVNTHNPTAMWQLLKSSLESNTILYLPLVAKLGYMTKSESISYLSELKERSGISNSVKSIAEKIIAEYSVSASTNFAEYYLKKEESEGLVFGRTKLASVGTSNGFFNSISAIANIKSHGFNLCDSAREHSGSFGCDSAQLEGKNDRAKKYLKMDTALSFIDFYGAMLKLNINDDFDSLDALIDSSSIIPGNVDYSMSDDSHKLMKIFGEFLNSVILEALTPDQLMGSKYVGSNRINVQRLYTFDDKNSDFSQLLQRYFEAKRKGSKNYEPNSFINSWLKRFDIGESIEIKLTEEGFGATIYLTKLNGERVLLADEGYGISQLVSVILEIETAILESRVSMRRVEGAVNPFGLLQDSEKELCYQPSTIAIEEPEVHLHPRYQSMLAEMFLEAYKLYNIHFIVETHSEYLIRKLQTIVAKQGVSSSDVALHYIDRAEGAQSPNVRHIEIEADGRLNSPLGSGFFDEADNLAMNLLEIKAGL